MHHTCRDALTETIYPDHCWHVSHSRQLNLKHPVRAGIHERILVCCRHACPESRVIHEDHIEAILFHASRSSVNCNNKYEGGNDAQLTDQRG
jgi:hypothetical protein